MSALLSPRSRSHSRSRSRSAVSSDCPHILVNPCRSSRERRVERMGRLGSRPAAAAAAVAATAVELVLLGNLCELVLPQVNLIWCECAKGKRPAA